ncbi:putative NAD(P)H nitroreductase YdjA [Pseudovibrio axinellae]|uniref:Putative NAD(P)H nitroreductase n=1 Tax=Pseudovibrio axinellae TaxID=989403 RepID=A0A161V5Q9_9HYPH|nr:nitroreductase family protein [Pseudovibrio axinellae]KZL20200.1 putative NAD(P)H nitroreductase YdjA [Pseudovibrio axinellae]SEQ60664.1 Nitroreductase [Pseudovibrio axinellae]
MNAQQLVEIIRTRTSAPLRHMSPPGPNADELKLIVEAAAAAPDHGRLHPFRIMEIPADARNALGALFEEGVKAAHEAPTEEALSRAREKAQRGPVLLVLVGCFHGADETSIPKYEQMISAGTALQNMVLVAHTLGYASRITSGTTARSAIFHKGLGLSENEEFLCFISLGKVDEARPAKGRQEVQEIFSVWSPE